MSVLLRPGTLVTRMLNRRGGGGFHGVDGFRKGGGHPVGGFPGADRGGVGVRVGPGFNGEHFGGERVHIEPGVDFGRPHWGNGFWGWRNNSWVWLAGPHWVTPDYSDWVWVGAQWVDILADIVGVTVLEGRTRRRLWLCYRAVGDFIRFEATYDHPPPY